MPVNRSTIPLVAVILVTSIGIRCPELRKIGRSHVVPTCADERMQQGTVELKDPRQEHEAVRVLRLCIEFTVTSTDKATFSQSNMRQGLERRCIIARLRSMKQSSPVLISIEKALVQVFAHAKSRVLRRDMKSEMRRLNGLSSGRRYVELASFFGALFALSVLSASFGWMAFGAFFLVVAVVFY